MLDINVITNPEFFVPALDLLFTASIAAYALWQSAAENDLANSTTDAKKARKLYRLSTAKKRNLAIASAIWFLASATYKFVTFP